ncbi:PLP-dependent aminotransferase family protein [Mesorhizobium delmotii]|uniref:Aminotransferase class I/classII large domain-containing protein n=1 Tax=Mesorhizobium delmotii TaxID=1631247 RepID=A0A2P9AGG4_9HYPH|nr:PLP-dependent aminotransferase family protein [Mesorhizobium delmotii]SJM30217.1 hypothetical protein BQ8482_130116 [Mesorhizobium delmotii]
MNTQQASSPMPQAGMIDMTRTMPPQIEGFETYIQDGMSYVVGRDDLSQLVQRHRFFGTDSERAVSAEWLSTRLGFRPEADRVFMTGGTQNSLQILLARLGGTAGCVATETLSYAGTTQICGLLGLKLVGIPIDEYGIIPEAFADVCERDRPRVLYCNPTIHNPTTSVLPEARRSAIAEMARKYGVSIIEDDVHGMIALDVPAPIASIAPDITWYIMSVSKCIGMGLRTAFLVAPSSTALAELRGPVQSISAWFIPAISSALITHLIETGSADEIAMKIRDEVEVRQQIATEALHGQVFHTHKNALHLWLGLPDHWTPTKLAEAVRPFKVQIRPSDLFNAGGMTMPNKIRLSLVAPQTRQDLTNAMVALVKNLRNGPVR